MEQGDEVLIFPHTHWLSWIRGVGQIPPLGKPTRNIHFQLKICVRKVFLPVRTFYASFLLLRGFRNIYQHLLFTENVCPLRASVTCGLPDIRHCVNGRIRYFRSFLLLYDLSPAGPANPLQWRHNERDGISNHQPHDCLLSRLFRRIAKKTSNPSSLAFVRGIHRWPVNFPHKGPATRKMFPFDDVILPRFPVKISFTPEGLKLAIRRRRGKRFHVMMSPWSQIQISGNWSREHINHDIYIHIKKNGHSQTWNFHRFQLNSGHVLNSYAFQVLVKIFECIQWQYDVDGIEVSVFQFVPLLWIYFAHNYIKLGTPAYLFEVVTSVSALL